MDNLENNDVITLTDEDGVDKDFVIVETAEYKNKVYAALTDADSCDEDECEFMILRIDPDEENEDESVFNTITDEDEFNAVLEAIEAKLGDEYDFDVDND